MRRPQTADLRLGALASGGRHGESGRLPLPRRAQPQAEVGGPVGYAGRHDTGSAAVWTSVDGIGWTRVPHDDQVFGGYSGLDAHAMTTVTAGGPGLVAVGWVLNPWEADAVVWTSPDGITWSRIPHDEEVFGGPSYQAMWAVTAGGPGLVAVGEDRSRDFGDGDAAVWTSADGITWTRVPHDEDVFGGPGDQEMQRVTAGGPGYVGRSGRRVPRGVDLTGRTFLVSGSP